MNTPTPLIATALLAASLVSGAAQAALNDRGGGLIYDDVLNVTWLQDANYAKTSGYSVDGFMTWTEATNWADALVYHDSARNVDYSGWRLASNTPVNGVSWNYDDSGAAGTTDQGYNITSPNSELAYMYYMNLGLKAPYSTTGADQSNSGVPGTSYYGDQADITVGDVKVMNLLSSAYWSGTAYAPNPTHYAWNFRTSNGYQSIRVQDVRGGSLGGSRRRCRSRPRSINLRHDAGWLGAGWRDGPPQETSPRLNGQLCAIRTGALAPGFLW